MMTMAMMAADMVNMMAGSSMTTAAPTLVWKNPIAASQPLQGARERVGAGSPADGGPRPRAPGALRRGGGTRPAEGRAVRTRTTAVTANSGHDARRTPLSGRVHPSGGRRATPTRGAGVRPPPPAPPKNAAAARGTSSCAPWRPRSGTAATRRRAEATLDLSGRREAELGRHSKVPRHPRVTGPCEGRPLVPHAGLAGRGGGKHGVLEDVFLSSNKIARFRSQETSDDTRETASPAAPPR